MMGAVGKGIIGWWRSLSSGARISFCLFVLLAVASLCGVLHWLPGLEKAQQRVIDRAASGKPVPHHYYVPVWGFYAAVANFGIGVLMTGLVAWWGRLDGSAKGSEVPVRSLERMGRGAFLSALLAMVVAASLNAPRLRFSLWDDEQNTAKEYAVGRFKYDDEGRLNFRPVTWPDVFFNYKTANNHILFTAAAKLSHDLLFRPSSDPRGGYFVEWIIRLPAFLAGLLAIPVLSWLVHLLGFPRGAGWAPWFLIGHAWFTRYGCDARGYALLILFMPLFVALGIAAVRTGRWRWWIAVGAVSAALLLTYPGALYWVGLIQLVIVFFLLRERRGRVERTGRWFIAQVVAGMLFLQLFAPCLPQISVYMETIFASETGCDARWIIDELAYLGTGDAWYSWDSGNPFAVTLKEQLRTRPFRVGAGLMVLAALLLSGLWRTCRRVEAGMWVIALLAGGVVAVLHAVWGSRFLYSWYLVPSFVVVPVLLAVGVAGVVRRVPGWKGLCLGGVLVFMAWQPSGYRNRLLRTYPVAPLRESVEVYREISNPLHPDYGKDVMSLAVHMMTDAYDPAGVRVRDEAGLLKKMAESDEAGIPLFINVGLVGLGVEQLPEIFAVLQDPERFETIGPIWGLWKPCSRTIYRYLGSGGESG